MIDSQLVDLNQDLAKRLLRNPNLKSYKSVSFSLDHNSLILKAVNRAGEEFSQSITHHDLPSVKLDLDTMRAYYEADKINNFPLSLEDYAHGLDYEFLESKEPELLNQLITLEILQSLNLELKCIEILSAN